MTKAFTDTIFQNIKLYIEGVEVPFSYISITSGIGGLPQAQITIPPQAGLMDISRFYQPKVHIFFEDRLNDYDDKDPDDRKRRDKLLFSGIIARPIYSKSKDVASSLGVSFECVHRYNLINEMLIDYTGWLNADPLNSNAQEAAIKADTANSNATIIEALSGICDPDKVKGEEISKENPDGMTNILPFRFSKLYTRLLGMPGVLINFWNQMKRSAYNRQMRQGDLYYSEAFVRIYQPLIEDGLKFFDRLGGHFPIEAMVQADEHRVDPCPDTPNKKEKIVVPPSRQLFLTSSVQAEMTISNIASYLQNSGEVTTIYQMFSNFFDSIDYEIVTLASPAEVAVRSNTVDGDSAAEFAAAEGTKSETFALDTIVKPKLPFYFSPTCNVLFPGMYSSINVSYDDIGVPTRINLKNMEGPGEQGFNTNFRAPASVREAIAKKVAGVNGVPGYNPDQRYSLLATTGQSYGAIGLYEQGRGIKQETMHIPKWLAHFSQSTTGGHQPVQDTPPDAKKEAAKNEALRQLSAGWSTRYPGDPMKTLNPYSVVDSNLSSHHRMLFSAADYYYTQVFARSKAGTVSCPFNPFIVPGYPMDILEANPTYPSFHAMCSSVTHSFSAESCGTSVQFVAPMTYTELANYYIPFVSPMLQVALGLAENPTMVNPDEAARKTAEEFYAYTLGTPYVSPDQLMDFSTMQVKPQKWDSGSAKWVYGSNQSIRDSSNGGERNPMFSYEGNLSLVYRDIETRKEVEDRFALNFIDFNPGNYGPTVVRYRDKQLDNATKYEIGRSQFLTYDTYFGAEITSPTTTVANNPSAEIVKEVDLTKGFTSTNRKGQ